MFKDSTASLQWLDIASNCNKTATSITVTLEAQFVFELHGTAHHHRPGQPRILPGNGLNKPTVLITTQKVAPLKAMQQQLNHANLDPTMDLLEEIFASSIADRLEKVAQYFRMEAALHCHYLPFLQPFGTLLPLRGPVVKIYQLSPLQGLQQHQLKFCSVLTSRLGFWQINALTELHLEDPTIPLEALQLHLVLMLVGSDPHQHDLIPQLFQTLLQLSCLTWTSLSSIGLWPRKTLLPNKAQKPMMSAMGHHLGAEQHGSPPPYDTIVNNQPVVYIQNGIIVRINQRQ
ncbi:hypothetical protein F4604DRAFT_1683952 [Suillus subluteus]|nr:hypothetical protein F4604DRAFT_1683952 [Suillus subluteus]